jgi:hypothetical protein
MPRLHGRTSAAPSLFTLLLLAVAAVLALELFGVIDLVAGLGPR